MVLLQDLSERLQANEPEERQIISGVSWEQYEALLSELGNCSRGIFTTNLEGDKR